MEQEDSPELPVLPVVRQPTGVPYYLGTWSGRILVINALIFLWMVWRDPSALLAPSLEYIRAFGSKSLADIALGEYWRFITPIFVHIGIIHFFFNTMALYYIGYQIEYILGGRWFLLVYFISGIVGNLSSCIFSLTPSAGASGALFGLLGAGFRLEGLLSDAFDQQGGKKRPRKRMYSGLVITNIILGLIIPVIDNAAHIGGLIAGWLLTESMLRTRPNRLRQHNVLVANLIFALIGFFSLAAVIGSTNKNWTFNRYFSSGMKADSAPKAYRDFSEALRIIPSDSRARVYRGKLLLQAGETQAGADDVRLALSTGKLPQEDYNRVLEELELTGHPLEAELVRKIAQDVKSKDI